MAARDTNGTLLDRELHPFVLGITSGEITSFTATPQSFSIGDSVNISMTFRNTGSNSITGIALIKAENEDGETIAVFKHDLTGLAANAPATFNDTWNTTGATGDSFNLRAFVSFDSEAAQPVSIALTAPNIPGDANSDGNINALDITKVERVIAGMDAQTPGADANQDGSMNALDITTVERKIAGLV